MDLNKIYNGDALETVKTFDDNSIDCVITSPPYYQLRDYGFAEQWGLEKTYQEYLDKMVDLMSELKRVLKPTGTMWINLGDSYNGLKQGNTQGTYKDGVDKSKSYANTNTFLKPKQKMQDKSLMLIPHRFAIRCIDELGLILRNDVIWAKRNGMPESVTDRFSKKHEFFFFFVKQQKYYFDLDGIRDKHSYEDRRGDNRVEYLGKSNGNNKQGATYMGQTKGGKNPGDVSDFWDVAMHPSSAKHYATYNFDLIDKPIIAGCPESGVVLDPFCGTGTTLKRAIQLGRKIIGVEGKKEYCDLAEKNIAYELSQTHLFDKVI